jgi:hypothetical protein
LLAQELLHLDAVLLDLPDAHVVEVGRFEAVELGQWRQLREE